MKRFVYGVLAWLALSAAAFAQSLSPGAGGVTTPPAITAGGLWVAHYDFRTPSTANMSLVPLTVRPNFPATSGFDANYLEAAHNLFPAASGALSDLNTNYPGAQANNPIWYSRNVVDFNGGVTPLSNAKVIGTPAGTGVPNQAGNETVAEISFTMRNGDRTVNNTATTFPVIMSIGSKFSFGHAGSTLPTGATVVGQLGIETGTTTFIPIESGAVSRSNQTVVVSFVLCGASVSSCGTGQAPDTIRPFVDGVQGPTDITFVPDTVTPSQVVVGGPPAPTQLNWNICDCFVHEVLIGTGAISTSDVAAITAYLNTDLDGFMGHAWGACNLWGVGQSNRQAYQGLSPSAGTINAQPLDYAIPYANRVRAELLGTPACVDRSDAATGLTYLANTPLLESNHAWANSTTFNASPIAIYNDNSSSTPANWTQITTVNTLGNRVFTTLNTYPYKATLPFIEYFQGENDGNDIQCANCNWNVTTSPYIGQTPVQRMAEWQQGLTRLVSDLRTETGNANLELALHILGGGNGYDFVRMAQLEWVDQNPTLGFALDPGSWQYATIDASSAPHEAAPSYPAIGRYIARTEAGWLIANDLAPTSTRTAGPTHWQSPRITSISGVGGTRTVTVNFSNPNGAGSLIVQPSYTTTCSTTASNQTVTVGSTANMTLGDPFYLAGAIPYHNAINSIVDATHVTLRSAATGTQTGGTCTGGVNTLGWDVWVQGASYGGTFAGTTTTMMGAGTVELSGFELTGSQFGEIVSAVSLSAPFSVNLTIGNTLISGNTFTVCYGREGVNLSYMTVLSPGSLYAYSPGFGRMLMDNSATTTPAEPYAENDNIDIPVRDQPECIKATAA